MKWIVLSTYSPKIGDLYEVTCPNKERYCDLHGYKLDIVHFVDDDINNGYGSGWVKLLHRARSYLKEGFGVMLIDADAIIANLNIKIDDRIKHSDAVVVAREPEPHCPMNGGVVLMNPCKNAIKYLDTLIEHWVEWKDDPLVPQGWVCKHMNHPAIKHALRIVSPAELNAIPEERDNYPQNDPDDLWKKGDWICHPYGMSLERKIWWAKKLCTT